MLQEINNLRLRVGLESERSLNQDERERALKKLRSGKDINLVRPTRDLGLPSEAVFNLSRGVRKTIKGDETSQRLMKKREERQEGPAVVREPVAENPP